MARDGLGCGCAARSHGENSPETRGLATVGLPGLGDWPGHNQGDLAGSDMGVTPAREHQRAMHTARRANGGAGNSEEQSHAKQGSNDQIKGTSRLLTSSRSTSIAKQRRRRKGLMGRRWRSSDCIGELQ
jgi:hypothetical protein